MGAAGLTLAEAEQEPAIPHMPELGEHATRARAFEDERLVQADPAYGHIVCFCERVTEGEVRDALAASGARQRRRGPPPPHPGHQWALSGLLLRRGHRGPVGGAVST